MAKPATTVSGLQPYPAYKPSGVEWLGDVPEHWNVLRGKQILRCIDIRSTSGEEELLTVSSERGVVPRASATVTMFKAESYIGHKLCWPGDLVINSLWAWARGLGVSRHHGIISSAYGVYRLRRPYSDYTAFMHELVRSTPFHFELQVQSRGIWISRLQLTDQAFLGAQFPIPPPQDRDAIACFLDHADRRIRRCIQAKEKLVELLEEQRQAIINEAVTGRVDVRTGQRYPAYKPSGVEWLGEIPEEWAVRRLGQLAISFRTGPFGSMIHRSDYVDGGTPLINPVHMRQGRIVEDPCCSISSSVGQRLSNYRLEKHDLVFARRGELGRCALVRDRESGWLCGTGSIRVRIAYADIEPEYLISALQGAWVGEHLSISSVGTTMKNLNTAILKRVPVLVPPLETQRHLLKQITLRSRKIDLAISWLHQQTALLSEFRTRLISDVVTGKLDVRDAAAKLAADLEEPESITRPDASVVMGGGSPQRPNVAT